MRLERKFRMIEAHAEGEIGRVITDGIPPIPGDTLSEKFRWLLNEDDGLRLSICLEPRGCAAGSSILLFPPEDDNNHAGMIVLQPDQPHAMSGSNAICTTTVLLESGLVEMQEGQNEIRLETAAGLVAARAQCHSGKCQTVSLTMPPSFIERLDYSFDAKPWGSLKADIAFGGVFYAIINPDQLGLTIKSAEARFLADAGMVLKEQLNRQMEVFHPQFPEISGIAYVMFRSNDPDGSVRTATTMWPGRLDRSPCGTGNSANLAARVARGEIEEGGTYLSRSTIGSTFQVRHTGTTKIGERQAVIPEITGRAWIYGVHEIGYDPNDPFREGFALTDTWGLAAGEIRSQK